MAEAREGGERASGGGGRRSGAPRRAPPRGPHRYRHGGHGIAVAGARGARRAPRPRVCPPRRRVAARRGADAATSSVALLPQPRVAMPLVLPPTPPLNDTRAAWGAAGATGQPLRRESTGAVPPHLPHVPARVGRRVGGGGAARLSCLTPTRGANTATEIWRPPRPAPSRRVPLPQQAAGVRKVQRQATPPPALPPCGRHARRHVRDRHRGRRASVVVTPPEGAEASALTDGHGRNGCRPASPPTPPTPAPRRTLCCTPRWSAQMTARGSLRQQHRPPGRPPARRPPESSGRGWPAPAASRGHRPSPPSWWGRPATRAAGMPAATPA